MTAIEKFLCTVVFICSLILFTGCDNGARKSRAAEKMFGINPTAPIHFIVPVAFRGRILIVEDKTDGVAPSLSNGKIAIVVPPDGRVVLRDWSPFLSDHEESASYADGTAIPDPDFVPVGSAFPTDKIGFWKLGMDFGGKNLDEKSIVRFIGTKAELDTLK